MEVADSLNETSVKNLVLNLERRYNLNQKLRIKYLESPTKFANSETDLFASLDELQNIATQPELYHLLTSKTTLTVLISLISHENTDVSAKTLGLIQELTDLDDLDDQKPASDLIKALLEENLVDIVISNLDRLDATVKEEAQAINSSVSIIDNLMEFDPESLSKSSKPLIKFMLTHLSKNPEYNQSKLSISELLSVLLMNSCENRVHLVESGGVDILLQQVSYYRRTAPITGDQHEFLEQIISCLCTSMLDCEEAKKSFLEEEGVDLIEHILREKSEAAKKSNIKVSTLKMFSHLITPEKDQDKIVQQCCERFVHILGLRSLFPIFDNPKVILSEKTRKRDYYQTLDEIEEHTVSIVLTFLKHIKDTDLIQRVLVKFADSDFRKLNRLFSLHDKYFKVVALQSSEEETDSVESGSRFTLRSIDYIILLVSYLGNQFEIYDPSSGKTLTSRLAKMLGQRPELRHQIVIETRRLCEELAESEGERNSLQLLLEYFNELCERSKKERS